MPGFNQRGPMNEGSMTGRKKGTCTGEAIDSQRFAKSAARGYGDRMGRGPGRKRCQASGREMGYGRGPAPVTAPDSVNQDTLQNRVNMLEAELSAIKNQLRTQSE